MIGHEPDLRLQSPTRIFIVCFLLFSENSFLIFTRSLAVKGFRFHWLFDRDRGDREKRPTLDSRISEEATNANGDAVPALSSRARRHPHFNEEDEIHENEDDEQRTLSRPGRRKNTLQIHLPTTMPGSFTLSQARTPGWNSPWVPNNFKLPPPDSAHFSGRSRDSRLDTGSLGSFHSSEHQRMGKWGQRRKNFRTCVLYHNYVPLVCNPAGLKCPAERLTTHS